MNACSVSEKSEGADYIIMCVVAGSIKPGLYYYQHIFQKVGCCGNEKGAKLFLC